ncbi:MAG: hypothetical protein WAY38_01510, partial [Gemmiger qucibialis]
MEFTGVGGKIKLDENGDAVKSIAFNTFVDGKVKWSETLDSDGNLVSSAESSFLVFPKHPLQSKGAMVRAAMQAAVRTFLFFGFPRIKHSQKMIGKVNGP